MKARNNKSTLRRLSRDILSQRSLLVIATVGTIIQVALTVYLPILIGDAVDSVLKKNAVLLISSLIWQMLAVIVANSAIQWLNPLIYNRLIYSYSESLRERVMMKIHALPLSYLDRQGTGDMVSRVTTDSDQLNNGLLMVFNQFFVGLLTIFVIIITMARLDWFMMLLVLVMTPLSVLVARFIARKSYQLYRHQTKWRGMQTQLIEESLTQEALVQSLNAQSQMVRNFREVNGKYAAYSRGAIFYSSAVNPATRFVNSLIYALIAGVGAYRIMSGGAFTVGQLTTFLNYVTQYTKPFNDISSVLSELQSALACADRLYMILDENEIPETGHLVLEEEDVQGQFQFDHIQFGYLSNKPLIKDLSIDIPAASTVAIVGPTGAGKSTLINLLMRFYDLDKGQLRLDGRSITDYTRESLRKQIGMVLQETWLEVGTIHDNIAYGNPKASREEVIAAAKAANADFFINQLPQGYDTYLSDAGQSLSQGQRQLLTIARIFVNLPKILILDEATSSIDTRTELLIQEAFAKLMKGRTSFIIAHRLSTIENADLILVMNNGDIVEYGTHHQLMKAKGMYYQMQTAQKTQNS
ncbi:MAG: ABC transporter ATP-binding protein [Streptococcus sp.]|uniref:ABC transporter ATP-binding protein n=1 Tax=Streptococcus sp. TaxID=1306 RepID=UPI00290377E9|nr:ABC transporter ATP-binding protein [Streptococcus sp.]MDU3069188.1 ABC transporter ATP-binding protein [Streptococcus sp.]